MHSRTDSTTTEYIYSCSCYYFLNIYTIFYQCINDRTNQKIYMEVVIISMKVTTMRSFIKSTHMQDCVTTRNLKIIITSYIFS